jgi:hypothetical protein
MNRIYDNWADFPAAEWRWPDFSPQEMACRGTGRLMIDERSMDMLQALRAKVGRPMLINSAYRSPEHNAAVGGAKASEHLRARAFDVSMSNHDPALFIAAAKALGFKGIGTYPDQNFVHVDTRETPARWGKPFPARATRFAPEPLPPKKTQAAVEGGSVVAVAAGGAAVVREAMPFLPANWVGYAAIATAVLGLVVVVWRAFGPREAEPPSETALEEL